MSLREELKNKIWKDFNLFNEGHKHLPKKDFFIANATYLINRCAMYEERYTKERQAKEELLEALKKSKRSHYYCEDCWYSCPKSEDGCCDDRQGDECNCGADRWNNYIDELISKHTEKHRRDK